MQRIVYASCLALLLTLSLTGCGAMRFGNAWSKAMEDERRLAKEKPPVRDITGAWAGRWESSVTGHNGRLRAVVTGDDQKGYIANFDAEYLAVLHYRYTLNLTASPAANGVRSLTGDADLGMFGKYTYDGVASSETFDCNYKAEGDHGKFTLRRPPLE